jgi:hypothetical protein
MINGGYGCFPLPAIIFLGIFFTLRCEYDENGRYQTESICFGDKFWADE